MEKTFIQRLADLKAELHKSPIKETGINKHSGFKYFQIGDYEPVFGLQHQRLCGARLRVYGRTFGHWRRQYGGCAGRSDPAEYEEPDRYGMCGHRCSKEVLQACRLRQSPCCPLRVH